MSIQPRREEQYAASVVSAITGARAEFADVAGAAAASVDYRLLFDDGRRGALEVTWLGSPAEFQLRKLLDDRNNSLPYIGKSKWVLSVAHPRELLRLESIYQAVLPVFEDHDAAQIEAIPFDVILGNEHLLWLHDEALSSFTRLRPSPTSTPPTDNLSKVYLLGQGVSAAWSSDGDAVSEALEVALTEEPALGHMKKLAACDTDERHLFFAVASTGLSPAAFMSLTDTEGLPTEPPAVLPGITDLWFATGFTRHIVRWSRADGWTRNALP